MDTSGTVTIVPVIVTVVFVAAALALFIRCGLYILKKTHISYNCSLSVLPKKWPSARHGGSEAVGLVRGTQPPPPRHQVAQLLRYPELSCAMLTRCMHLGSSRGSAQRNVATDRTGTT